MITSENNPTYLLEVAFSADPLVQSCFVPVELYLHCHLVESQSSYLGSDVGRTVTETDYWTVLSGGWLVWASQLGTWGRGVRRRCPQWPRRWHSLLPLLSTYTHAHQMYVYPMSRYVYPMSRYRNYYTYIRTYVVHMITFTHIYQPPLYALLTSVLGPSSL